MKQSTIEKQIQGVKYAQSQQNKKDIETRSLTQLFF